MGEVTEKIDNWQWQNKDVIRIGLVGGPRVGKTTYLWALRRLRLGGKNFHLAPVPDIIEQELEAKQKAAEEDSSEKEEQEKDSEANQEPKAQEEDDKAKELPSPSNNHEKTVEEVKLYKPTNKLSFHEFNCRYKKHPYKIEILDYPGDILVSKKSGEFKNSDVKKFLATCDVYLLITDRTTSKESPIDLYPGEQGDYELLNDRLMDLVDNKSVSNFEEDQSAAKLPWWKPKAVWNFIKKKAMKVLLIFMGRPENRVKIMKLQYSPVFAIINKVDQYGCLYPPIDGEMLFNRYNSDVIHRSLDLKDGRHQNELKCSVKSGFHSRAWQHCLEKLIDNLKITFTDLVYKEATPREAKFYFVGYNIIPQKKQDTPYEAQENRHLYCPFTQDMVVRPFEDLMELIHQGRQIRLFNRFQKILCIMLVILILLAWKGII